MDAVKIIQMIAETYGYEAQSRQCIEEMAELTQAINKYWRKALKGGKVPTKISYMPTLPIIEYNNLVEELADVQIMIWQMTFMLNADVLQVVEQKLKRQILQISEMPDMDDAKKIKVIAETYGYEAQSRQCIEEMAELTQAINKYWRKALKGGKVPIRIGYMPTFPIIEYNNLVEELADVQIMIWQMKYLLSADILTVMDKKLKRQLERISR